MKEIRIEKITLNIGTAGAGDKLEKGMKLLEKITGKKPIQTKSQKRIPTWSVRPGLAVGTKVTIRGKEAEVLLKRLLISVNNELSKKCFDDKGNFSFGIPEYIDIPDIEYMIEIGIIGLEAAVTLERPGFRIKRRKYLKRKIPKKHSISKKEAIEYMKEKFNIELGEVERWQQATIEKNLHLLRKNQ